MEWRSPDPLTFKNRLQTKLEKTGPKNAGNPSFRIVYTSSSFAFLILFSTTNNHAFYHKCLSLVHRVYFFVPGGALFRCLCVYYPLLLRNSRDCEAILVLFCFALILLNSSSLHQRKTVSNGKTRNRKGKCFSFLFIFYLFCF